MFSRPLFILSALLCYEVSCSSELYSDKVQNYDSKTFKQNIGGPIPHFVNFYAPWCGYCKRLKPVWDELAEKYNTGSGQGIVIAKVDCTVETPTCADEGVSGYPSLIFYAAGETSGVKYQGKRDLIGLEDFISTNLEGKTIETASTVSPSPQELTGALQLTEEKFYTTVEYGLHFVKFFAPWCGHCQKLAPTWEKLAEYFKKDKSVTISKVDCTKTDKVCSQFEVRGYPTLLWIVNGKKEEQYQEGRSFDELKQFVLDMKVAHQDQNEEGRIPDNREEPDLVVALSKDNFDDTIAHGVSFVKFFVPWCKHCKNLAPTWNDLAIKFSSTSDVKIAQVDCSKEEELCGKHEIVGYPSLFIFRDGKFLKEYHGTRELGNLHSFVIEYLHHTEL